MTPPDQLFHWVECYGGPADGETIPVDPKDPLPTFPYASMDHSVTWYRLQQNAAGDLRFCMMGMLPDDRWTTLTEAHDQ